MRIWATMDETTFRKVLKLKHMLEDRDMAPKGWGDVVVELIRVYEEHVGEIPVDAEQ